jgi:N-acetylglutamate synthase-like GNAT family acetyltransferase
MSHELRAASESDGEAIAAIRENVLNTSQEGWAPNPDEDRVAVCDGAVVGWVQFCSSTQVEEIQREGAWIQSLAVDPDHQGDGIGSALVQSVVADAKESGVDGVGFLLDPSGDVARRKRFFGDLGFNYVSPTEPPIWWVETRGAKMSPGEHRA